MTDAGVLSDADLGRALVARQHLDQRTETTVVAEVLHLVGLQAQNPSSPYPALWSRLASFTQSDLGSALLDRSVARIAVMRGTIHLVTAADALLLPGLLEPVFARDLRANGAHGPALRAVHLPDVTRAARDLLETEPMTAARLGARLAERWPQTDPKALTYAARGTLALVQVTPRGVWGRSAPTTWTTARAWLGREPSDLGDPAVRHTALQELALRYLAAFGPASVADLQYWSGLTGLRAVLETLRPGLVCFRAQASGSGRPGRELFDVPDAPRPGPEAPAAPVRFVPDYDNLTIAHADRTRVISDEHRRRLWSPNGVTPGKVLVEGVVAGTWRVDHHRSGEGRAAQSVATLEISPFAPLSRPASSEVVEEAAALLRFLAGDAVSHEVRIADSRRPEPADG